jgi:hypothetical protein
MCNSIFLVVLQCQNCYRTYVFLGEGGIAPQAGRPQVRFSIVSLKFFIDNSYSRTVALGSTQPLTEMSTRNISWRLRRPVRRADNLTTLMCRLSWNLGDSTSWKPQDLSRLVEGLVYVLRMYFVTCRPRPAFSILCNISNFTNLWLLLLHISKISLNRNSFSNFG